MRLGSWGRGEGEGEGEGEGSNLGSGLSFRGIPAGLGMKVWTPDFNFGGNGRSNWPDRLNKRFIKARYEESQWDPPLRAVSAVVEFAGLAADWHRFGGEKFPYAGPAGAKAVGMTLDKLADLWRTNQDNFVDGEISELRQLMEDERARFMGEITAQINGAPKYFTGMLGISGNAKPWTQALMNYALRIGEFVGLHYKARYSRLRPSVLCPGLVPPFGPPAHPAFPSAHALQSTLTALLLLQIPGIYARFGVNGERDDFQPDDWEKVITDNGNESELLWLAARIARNRERAGVHYRSDSLAGKVLACATARMLMVQAKKLAEAERVFLPTTESKKPRSFAERAEQAKESASGSLPEFTMLLLKARGEWREA